ncbi:hypothetical protein F5Y06DRAFT_301548 [Hypoxylon sp. FL0890]|nr:hypothetical protein F5Y06DRAFT_301548 [Hypoxylon sp. FL0890]
MDNSQREYSRGTLEQLEARLAKAKSIQQEYAKKEQEQESAFTDRRDAIRSNIQQLQKELQDISDEYQTAKKTNRELYKKELENCIYVSSPPKELDEEGPQETSLGQTKPSSHPHQIDDNRSHIEDEIIVQDSHSESEASEQSDFDTERQRGGQRFPKRRVRIEEPFKGEGHSDARPSKRPRRGRQGNDLNREQASSASGSTKKNTKGAFKGITNPTVGRIYKVHKPQTIGYAAVVLPTGDFREIGISKSLRDSSLGRSIPACYKYDKQSMAILGWKEDYEDGGPKVTSRKVPMMYFDEPTVRISQDGDFTADNAIFEWVSVESLRPLSLDVKLSLNPTGYDNAKRFDDRLTLLRQKSHETPLPHRSGLQQGPQPTAETNWNIRTFQSINQETPGFDATLAHQEEQIQQQRQQLLSFQEHMQLNGTENLQEASFNVRTTGNPNESNTIHANTQESPDPLGDPEASTSQPTSRIEGIYDGTVHGTIYGPQSHNGFEPRRFEPVLSTNIPAIHTNLNDGDPDNLAGSAASSSTTQTLAEEPKQGSRTATKTRGNTDPNGKKGEAPGLEARDIAAGAFSYLNDHYNI